MSGSPEQQLFDGIRSLAATRAAHPAFHSDAFVETLDTGSNAVLGIRRVYGGEEVICLYNFSEWPQEITLDPAGEDLCADLCEDARACGTTLPGYAFRWVLVR